MCDLDVNQLASVNQLLQWCRDKITTVPSIILMTIGQTSQLPNVDNGIKSIESGLV
jgi:hypothetical protein